MFNVEVLSPLSGALIIYSSLIPTAHAVGYFIPPLAGLNDVTLKQRRSFVQDFFLRVSSFGAL